MTAFRRLTEIQRQPLALVLGDIGSEDTFKSAQAGQVLCNKAKEFGLNLRDYLTLSVDIPKSTVEVNGQQINPYLLAGGDHLSGYEAALMHLGLPTRQDFKQGILLEAAADTFNFKPGTRALFPEVIDDMLRWETRMDEMESTEGIVAQTRTIRGSEVLTRAILQDSEEARTTSMIAEGANIPVYDITATENNVKFYKHGSAIRTTYEFERRVAMDILKPYAARVERQLQISKVSAAVGKLINGDAAYAAAPVVNLSTHGADFTGGKTLKDNYIALMKFLVSRAKLGIPVDTMVGNLDMYLELFLMFNPTTANKSVAEHLQDKGGPKVSLAMDLMKGVSFKLASAAPANKLICFSRADTLEELIEANSDIRESEQAIKNQTITYTRTINSGYKLIFGDTRVVLNMA